MKIALRIFFAISMIGVTFSSMSCYRDTHVATDTMQYEHASEYQDITEHPVVVERDITELTVMVDRITSFPPLQDNERLTFSTLRVRRNHATPHIWTPTITVYAVRYNDTQDTFVLFSWDSVPWHHIQLSGDLRSCFFIVETVIAPDPVRRDLYVAAGSIGEIRRLLTDMGGANFRASRDGTFVLHASAFNMHSWCIRGMKLHSINLVNFSLIEVETGAILGEFEWQLDRPEFTHEIDPIEGVDIFWNDSIFQLHAVGYRGVVIAEAEFNPATMELQTLFIR